ncbi:MAG: hypothetical protein NZO16_07900, partial [Deltaproteobacteria bacterium]|nr:hypothetical protein [Deltaproteobacteria bacterium]
MTESEVTQELSSGLLSVTDIVNLANKAVGEIGFVRFEASVFQYKDIPGKYIIFDFADSQDTDSPSVTIQGWLFDEKLIKDARQQNFRQGDKVIVFGSLWVYKRRAAVSVKIL